MKILQTTFLASALVFGGTTSHAIGLDALVAGGALTAGDFTVTGFSYNDVGGSFGDLAVPSSGVDVTAALGINEAVITISFDQAVSLTAEDVFEINGGFTTALAGGSIWDFTTISLSATGSAASVDDVAFIEAGSNTLGDSVTIEDFSGTQSTTPVTAPDLTTFAFLWDAQGEAAFGGDNATLSSISITIGMVDTTAPPDVPLPAGLPLMLAGIGAFGWVARRRRS